ncbi:CHAD domain-containing protein [Acidipropionibacterium thoenii]|uniref:CHAD domain-containing protein n=1 Tax=Acidipropionibacterium thoenii TaxID=1751 RepID=UPI00041B97A1|nr:CHAD domain-containing protein [Acidipropionibacterium thoenii]
MSKAARSVQQYWAEQVELMRTLPAQVARRDPDGIHDLRAAGRRLRATIRIYRPLLHQKQAVRLLDELLWYNGVLGQARDAEVAAQHVKELLEAAGRGSEPHDADLEGAEELLHRLGAEQERTARQVDQMLAGDRSQALIGELTQFASDPWRNSLARSGKGPRRSRILARVAWAENRAAEIREQLDDVGLAGEALAPTRHRLRRRIKAARYAHESLGESVKGAAERADRHAEAADVLGEMQDAVVVAQVLAGDSSQAAEAVIAEQRRLSEDAARRAPGIVDRALS